MDGSNVSGIGRGTKLWFNQFPTMGGLAEGNGFTSSPHQAGNDTFADVEMAGQSVHSGQDVERVPVTILSDLVKQIGTSIGENIVSCLKSIPASDVSMAQLATANLSKVNLTVSHDSYEPHFFKGDNTDRLSVSEWEESIRVYLCKRGIVLCDRVEEVLGKLRGRARDVVTIGLRSRPSVDLKSGPQPVFDILRQHFDDSVTSFMPLADFYDTKPHSTETAVDYWIRLNKAMDSAVEGLKRQGKTLDNPSREVTVMFITHCPDTELSLVFSCKPLEEWTAADVQVRLDEHHRKKRLQQRQSTCPADSLQPAQATRVLHSHVQSAESSPAPQTSAPSRTLQTEGQSLEHVITLLERLLQRETSQRSRPSRAATSSCARSRGPCVIWR